MKKSSFLLFVIATLFCVGTSAEAQKFKPKSIVFEGAPDYSNKELLAAAQLTPGTVLDSSEMKAHAKLLMDCGAFSGLTFTFDGEVLKFKLEQTSNMFEARWGNIPFPITEKIFNAIRAKAPLFHGKLPSDGTMLDAAQEVIKNEFAARGAQVEITAVPYVDADTHQVSGMDIEVTSPVVVVGDLHIEGVSATLSDALKKQVQSWHGALFSTNNSADSIKLTLENFYADRGYAAAKVSIKQGDEPVFSTANIEVPFSIQIDEGKLYKLGKINLAAGIQLTPAEMNKALGLKEGDAPKSENLRNLWWTITSKYKSQGYLMCKVNPKVSTDDVNGIANYNVDVETGPKFYMGQVDFQGFSDDMTGAMTANWKLQPGMPFDMVYVTSYVTQFIAKNPAFASQQRGVKFNFYLNTDTKTRVVAVTFKRER